MSGLEAATLVKRIDADILANRQNLQDEVLKYLQDHVQDLARDLMEEGVVRIPTFAGVFTFTEDDLRAILGVTSQRMAHK